MHSFREITDSLYETPVNYAGHSEGFQRADLIGAAQGSVHIGFSIAELGPGGRIDACVHSYEKGVFVLEGEIELNRDGKVFRLGKFDFALIPIGTAYALRNTSGAPVKWVEKCAPQPKLPGGWVDSFFTKGLKWGEALSFDPLNPACSMIGRFDWSQIPPSQDINKYMWGWAKKMLIDSVLGSHQFNMFMIHFDDGGQTDEHDHSFEEAYLVLEGECTFKADGKEYVLRPGTIGWSGVGSPHGFFMNRGTHCRWLEIMTPQPPVQNGNRRLSAWDDIRSHMQG
jgi:quercetin dioxygenase-like cupin family protein